MQISNLTSEAKERWDKIPDWTQAKILNNVWCVNCQHLIGIKVESGKIIDNDDLLLEGKCNECGANVAQLIRSEKKSKMDKFSKEKVGFAVALLAAIITIKPILESNIGEKGYEIFTFCISVKNLYYLIAASLSFAVYIYAVQFLTRTYYKKIQFVGDISYATAIIVPIIYFSLWVLVEIAKFLGLAPLIGQIISVFIVVIIMLIPFIALTEVLNDPNVENFIVALLAILEKLRLTRVWYFLADNFNKLKENIHFSSKKSKDSENNK